MVVDVEGSVIAATFGVIIHVLLALLFLFSTVANILVIIIFYRRPALRTLSNRFVVSLLVFNLVATGFLLPVILFDSLIDVNVYWHSWMEQAICMAGQALTTLVTTGSISAALVIAIDQYCAVMAPLHYHRRITKPRAWVLLTGQWILAIAMAAFSLVDSSGKHFWKGCAELHHPAPPTAVTDDDAPETTTSRNQNHTSTGLIDQSVATTWTLVFVTSSVVCYVVPLALLTWMYVRIYSAAHRNSQRTRRASLTHSASELVVHCLGSSHNISGSTAQVNNSGSFSFGENRSAPSRTPSLRSTSSQIVHNLRYRISNASLFLYREEARAARVSVLVLVLVVFCWLPYHALLILHALPDKASVRLPSYAYYLALVAILLNSLFSPFLYAYRSRRIQREVRRLFGMPPKSRKGRVSRRVAAGNGKSLRSISPRRQLMHKQVRSSDALSPEEVQSVLNSSQSTTTTTASTVPFRPEGFLQKFTRLWGKKPVESVACGETPAAPASELTVVSVDISRSSFSSGTSTSSSGESDVSL